MFHATVAPKGRSMQPSATQKSGRKRNIRMLTHSGRMVLNLTMGEWAAVACSNSEGSWKATRSYLRKGRMEVFDAELWVMWIAPRRGEQEIMIFNDSQAAVRRAAHLEIGSGLQLARWINNEARTLLSDHDLETEIRWIPRHSGIPGNEEADRQANTAREGHESAIREQAFISAANRARRISERRAATKAQ